MKRPLLSIVLLALFLSLTAMTVTTATSVSDDFSTLEYKQPEDTDNDPYWWVINNGMNGQVYGEYGTSSRIYVVDGSYARLQLDPVENWPAVNDWYVGTEISELRTLHSYGLGQERWLPTPGHPVVATVLMRCSPGFNPDGSGGSKGSVGFWLWNGAAGQAPGNSIGFNWAEIHAGGTYGGLAVSAFDGSFAPFIERTPAVNMQDWNEYKMEWGDNGDGTQYVKYYLNGVQINEHLLTTPLPALSATIWHDNQFPRGRGPMTDFRNPSFSQWIDVDQIDIYQQ